MPRLHGRDHDRLRRWAQLEFRTCWQALDGWSLATTATHDPTLLRVRDRLIPWITPKEYNAHLASESRR